MQGGGKFPIVAAWPKAMAPFAAQGRTEWTAWHEQLAHPAVVGGSSCHCQAGPAGLPGAVLSELPPGLPSCHTARVSGSRTDPMSRMLLKGASAAAA